MFKKFAIAAPLAVLALGSSAVFAAGEAAHSISIVAHVPSKSFYVLPVDPDLVTKDQDMSYVESTNSMKTINSFFDLHNSNGSVHSSLAYMPKLYAGASVIPLKVEMNGVELSLTPQQIVGEEESNTNYRAPFKISAVGTTFNPGDYTGTVAMTFDAVLPVGP
ncbi:MULTISPECIES: CS1 type fimbrial major subunit [unclassified Pseudomonas]|uniref:CS1 type fimbrial major subunit n=1 Tax=Pseudomonas sp. Ant30-3 TaxID=1488328 RepID=UPI00048E19ED|nr:CS1 type fimbrial major subunit [Pseudomonas sp. Ant30-3]